MLVFVRVAADLHQDRVLGAYVRDLGIRSPSAIEPTLATRFGEASSALDIVAFQEGLEATSTPAAVARPTWVFAVGFACALAVGMAWRSNRQAAPTPRTPTTFALGVGRSDGPRLLRRCSRRSSIRSTRQDRMLSPNPLRTAGILLSLAVPIVVAVLAPHPYRRPPGALARAVDRVKRLLP
ncbi:MAG: hypothetical protein R2702_10155 [Acidimicrobiales bacterium]